jgi:hypothetical protein
MTTNDSNSSTLRFLRTLEQAVHDARHEADGTARIVHFWDDDSLYLPIRGALALNGKYPSSFDRNELVQSLFSAGFLGPVRLLRPHRSELIGQIAAWQNDRARFEGGRTIANQLGSEEIRSVEKILDSFGDQVMNDHIARETVAAFGQLTDRAFVVFESLVGTWHSRLDRLVRSGLLGLEGSGLSLRSIRAQPEYEVIALKLNRVRSGQYPLATAIDAAALTAVIHMNRVAPKSSPRIYPRFFTSSAALIRLYQGDREFSSLLRFPRGKNSMPGTVWRDADYYFLRAIFPALRVGGAATPLDPTVGLGPTLDELDSLVDTLRSLRHDASALNVFVQDHYFDDESSLWSHLERFQGTFMSDIWLSHDFRTDGYLHETLRSLSELRASDEVIQARQRLRSDVATSVQSEIRGVQLAVEMIDAVQSALASFAAARNKADVSLKRDLSSVRWGIELNDRLDIVHRPPTNARHNFVDFLQMFDVDSLRDDRDEALRSVALVLGLERFALAQELLTHLTTFVGDQHFDLLRVVARLGSDDRIEAEDVRRMVGEAQREWLILPAERCPVLVLTYAHLALLGWRRTTRGWLGDSPPQDLSGWIEWSIGIVEEWQGRLSELAEEQALNFLLYARTCIGQAPRGGDDELSNFVRLAVDRDDFHFLDTAGLALLLRAQDGTPSPSGAVPRDLRESALALLLRASVIFPADQEVQQHLRTVRDAIAAED